MEWIRFQDLGEKIAVPAGYGDKTEEEIWQLAVSILRDGWRKSEPLVLSRRGEEIFRHPVDGNHRLRALRRLREHGAGVLVPVRWVEV